MSFQQQTPSWQPQPPQHHQQHQQQHQQQQQSPTSKTHEELQEEYRSTQRLAAETVEVGRATLTQTAMQTEQLQHADHLADHQKYVLDKSARLLRGMTWSGWVANMFTKDIKKGDYVKKNQQQSGGEDDKSNNIAIPPPNTEQYAQLPPKFQPAAQSIVNYQCNLSILSQCQDSEQIHACLNTCDDLSRKATQEMRKLNGLDMEGQDRSIYDGLVQDLTGADDVKRALVNRQKQQNQQQRGNCGGQSTRSSSSAIRTRPPMTPQNSLATNLTRDAPGNTSAPPPNRTSAHLQAQDDHLEALSNNLSELQGIGEALHTTFHSQNQLLDSIETKTDDLTEQTKTVRRKADRIVHRSKWIKNRPELKDWITVRHVRSGLYLCATAEGTLQLKGFSGPTHPAAILGKWKRKDSNVIGLQSKLTRKYVGQTMLGYLACSASNYGRSEEWEIDHEDRETAIMCVGANWGNGGWLEVNESDWSISIGGSGIAAKKRAALWRIALVEDDGGGER